MHQVQGVIDPPVASYVRGSIERSESLGATVILQIDSKGGFGDEAVRLGRMIRSSSVPVIAWIGPSGAHAAGGALFLVYGSSLATMAPGAGLGPAKPFDLATSASRERSDLVNERSATLAALADGAGARPEAVRQLVNGPALAAAPAQQLGAIALVAKDIPDLLRKLDGRTVSTNGGPVSLATASSPGRPVAIRFHELGPVRRVLHAVDALGRLRDGVYAVVARHSLHLELHRLRHNPLLLTLFLLSPPIGLKIAIRCCDVLRHDRRPTRGDHRN